MEPRSLVAARPHFRQLGNELSFFLSDRVFHSLNQAEAAVWKRLQTGPLLLEDLDDPGAVESLADAKLVEVVAPVPVANRRVVLVVEPHCDDAALSIGATMWKLRGEVEFHLLTMASRSNYTSSFHLHRDYFDRSEVTAMRTAEGKLFALHLAGHYHCAGLSEATLRYDDSDWSLDYFEAHEASIAISNNRRADDAVLGAWVKRLEKFLSGRRFEEIWIPLGAGTHSDHDLARNVALQVVMENRPEATVRIYEDVPYGSQFQEHTDRLLRLLTEAGASLSPWTQDVTDEYPKKMSLLTIFGSQFKVGAIEAGVERSAGEGHGRRRFERLWTIDALPDRLPRDEMWIGAPEIAKVSPQLIQFAKGAGSERRVAIFAVNAAGRWAKDLDRLSKLFPRAVFTVYAGPKVSAEFEAVKDPRVKLKRLDGRAVTWMLAALREAATGHRIVIAGEALWKARMMARLWPTGCKAIFPDMDHFSQALTVSQLLTARETRT